MFPFSVGPKPPAQILAEVPQNMQEPNSEVGMVRCSREVLYKIVDYVASDPRDLGPLAGVNRFYFGATYRPRVAAWVQASLVRMKMQAKLLAKEEYLARVFDMLEYLEHLPTDDSFFLDTFDSGMLRLIKSMKWNQLPDGYGYRVSKWILAAVKDSKLPSEQRLRIRLQLAITVATYDYDWVPYGYASAILERIARAVDELAAEDVSLLELVCQAHFYRINSRFDSPDQFNGVSCPELFDHAFSRLSALPLPKQLLALPELGMAARDDQAKIKRLLDFMKPLNVRDRTQVLLSWFRPRPNDEPMGLFGLQIEVCNLTESGAGWDILAPQLNSLLDEIARDPSLPSVRLLCHVAEALDFWDPNPRDFNRQWAETWRALNAKLVQQFRQLCGALSGNAAQLEQLMPLAVSAVLTQMGCAASLNLLHEGEFQLLWHACFDEQGQASSLLQVLLIACVKRGRSHPARAVLERLSRDLIGKDAEMVQLTLRVWAWGPSQENAVPEGLSILKMAHDLPSRLARVVASEILMPRSEPEDPIAAGRTLDGRVALALSRLPGWLQRFTAQYLIEECPAPELDEVLSNMLRHAAPREPGRRLKVLCAIGIALVARESLQDARSRFHFEAVLQKISQLPEPQRSRGLGRMLDKIRHALGRKGGAQFWLDYFLREIAMTAAQYKGSLLLRLGKLLPMLPAERRAAELEELLQQADTMPEETRKAWRLACSALAVDTVCQPDQTEVEIARLESISDESEGLAHEQKHFVQQICVATLIRLEREEEDSVGDLDDWNRTFDERQAKIRAEAAGAAAAAMDEGEGEGEDEDESEGGTDDSESMRLHSPDLPSRDSSSTGDGGEGDMELASDDDPDGEDGSEQG